MLRSVILLAAVIAAAAPSPAAIWPDQAGEYRKLSSKPVPVVQKPILDEYGFQEAEQAEYSGPHQFQAVAYRFKDSTGGFAAFQALRPPAAVASDLADYAVRADGTAIAAVGNYVLEFRGLTPDATLFEAITSQLPQVDRTPLPTLANYLPAKRRVPNSERFIVGPGSLAKFENRVPPAVANFDLSTEAQTAQYRLPGGTVNLTVFSYPTPQIALKQLPEFQKLPGAMAKRTGSLVAVLFSPPSPDDGERLLAAVRYGAEVTWNERLPNPRDNVADLLVNIFMLTGILIVLFLAAGIVVGFLRRAGLGKSREEMIVLRLDE
ncbi:MAG TPA: DUF6599 family protein [Bryobacteraceae bacterium]|nr:DUF6599 family protein [Bryobacteraceae bacterium]